MDDRRSLAAPAVPAPRRHPGADSVRLTCQGSGSPPLLVLARVQHVFCGPATGEVWPMLRRELRTGSVAPGDLVLLRVGRGTEEKWTELVAMDAA